MFGDRQQSFRPFPADVVSGLCDALFGSANSIAQQGRSAERLVGAGPIVDADANRERVLDALTAAEWVHFSCHTVADPTRPLGSRIQLPSSEELAVTDIFRNRSASARLAFLSGYGTAQTAERQADEAIPPSQRVLIAGYPQAMGTLWEIESTRARAAVRKFYYRLATMDIAETDTGSATVALHYVVRALHDAHPTGRRTGQPTSTPAFDREQCRRLWGSTKGENQKLATGESGLSMRTV